MYRALGYGIVGTIWAVFGDVALIVTTVLLVVIYFYLEDIARWIEGP